MRKPLIAANWKMNKTISEAVSTVKELKGLVKGVKDKEILICPSFTSLSSVSKEINGTNIELGAQNVYCEDCGAFTGEISAPMLKDIGCKYVIVGHSERRHIMNEDDEMINKKVKAAIANKLVPILCVGELLDERESGKMKVVVEKQLKEGLKDIKAEVVIAYEPVWAIGTGKTASPEQAEEMHSFIRKKLKETKINPDKTRILYGGSIKPENIKELMAQPNIDGGLVGGASLEAKSFSKIVNY